jgi:hypothetical protein
MNADASIYEIVTVTVVGANTLTIPGGVANNWTLGTAVAYPLAFGRLGERPELDARTPSKAECDLQFKEASIYARRLNQYPATIPTVGAQIPNLSALPLWPVTPTWSRVLDRTEAQVVFDEVGFGRVESKQVYSQPNARVLEMEFVCRSRDEIAAVDIFCGPKGQVSSFAIPTFRNDLQLAADVAPSTHTITVAVGEYSNAGRSAHQGDPYIAFVEATTFGHSAIDPHKIDTVAGATLTTNQAITIAHSKALARISFLLVARLVESKLPWSYSTDGRARCTLKFLELPNEYSAPSPVLKESFFAYLFVEQSKYPRTWLFTSYEDTIVLGGGQGIFAGSYAPALIGHKVLRRGLDLAAQKLEITSGSFAGNPLSLFFPRQLEGPLKLYVLEGNVADLTEPVKVRFFGKVSKPPPSLTSAQVQLLSDAELQENSRTTCFPRSTTSQFSPTPHGLNPADWKITGTIASIAGNTVVVTSAPANTLVTADATYFNYGNIEIGTTGATYETRLIMSAVAVTGGVQLTLNRPLIKTVATGGAIDLYPGYDGSIEQLTTRFADAINHGGMPFIPDTSPNIKAVNTAQSTGKK